MESSTVVMLVVGVVAFILGISMVFVIHTMEAGIVERFGKFNRIAAEGLNWKLPFIEENVYVEDLNMQLMDVHVQSKTKDDATITVPVRIQYYVMKEKVKDAYYMLDDPAVQIRAHVENVILSYIPTVTLDESYLQEDKIAARIREQLTVVMSRFGYAIENALVTSIVPSEKVTNAMNDINAARREQIATEARAEANKILIVKEAEANSEAKRLQGEGVAKERKAIVDGLRDSFKDLEEAGIDKKEVVMLLLAAIPHSPSAVPDLADSIRNGIIQAEALNHGAPKSK